MSFFTQMQLDGIRDFVDEMISTAAKSCKLIYQPKFVAGSHNLTVVDSTFKKNIGPAGNPITGQSYNEGGQGLISEESSENIDLVIDWTVKDSRVFAVNTSIPYAVIKTHGYLTDLNKILAAIEMQVDLPIFPIVKASYRFLGQGTDVFSIVKGRYFMGYWERIS